MLAGARDRKEMSGLSWDNSVDALETRGRAAFISLKQQQQQRKCIKRKKLSFRGSWNYTLSPGGPVKPITAKQNLYPSK